MEKIRVLIVDDLPQVRQGLATVLELAARRTQPAIEVVGEAQNGSEAIQQARLLQPDVILMDLEMPLIDGYETTRRIKAEQPATRIIILSVHADPEAIQHAQDAGADSFIVKGASTQDLLKAIQDRETRHQPLAASKGETP
jgi:two-component system, NarL family, nitrate/nitrite response regulator NarL